MKTLTIDNCPGTLAPGYHTYSPLCLRRMFNGKKISHILPYNNKAKGNQEDLFLENRKRISISGVQEKFSMLLQNKTIRPANQGEQGTYILKPIPRDVKNTDQAPANEHLTMQIAKQVYGINTAENALIFFDNGDPAYITLRFDVKPDGKKWRTEDFASLAGKSKDAGGPDYKYHYNYEALGLLIKQYVPAWKVEIEKYFQLVIFNYLFSNGDAHLKNFSLLETTHGDFTLSPAYDLLNTRIHVDDPLFALDGGLFADNYKSSSWKKNGGPNHLDFIEFGRRIGVQEKRIATLLEPFMQRQAKVEQLIERSFLRNSHKKSYIRSYNHKRNLLSY